MISKPPVSLPTSMRAALADRRGAALVLAELPVPEPGPGQILVRVAHAGVNFSDLKRRRGDLYPFPTAFPFVPGGEVAGTVVAHGAGVDAPPVGASVFALAGADGCGGYAEFAVAYAATASPIPEGVPTDVASVLTVAGLTARLMLTEVARLTAGDAIFVPAATGGVGSFAVSMARQLDAKVIAGVGHERKRAAAIALGAHEVVDTSREDWPEHVLAMTKQRGVDVALEAEGGPMSERALRCLAPFGRLVVFGAASGTSASLSPGALDRLFYAPATNQTVTGFNLGNWFRERPGVAGPALGALLGDVASGRVRPPPIRTLPLSRAQEAHDVLADRATHGKLVIEPWR